jgi:hypothetical protein
MSIHVNRLTRDVRRACLAYPIDLAGWFGLRRDLCEILLGQCPVMTLFFNNQYKFGPRPSTTVPINDMIMDTGSSTTNKTFEAIHMNPLPTTTISKENQSTAKYQCMSLSEPD